MFICFSHLCFPGKPSATAKKIKIEQKSRKTERRGKHIFSYVLICMWFVFHTKHLHSARLVLKTIVWRSLRQPKKDSYSCQTQSSPNPIDEKQYWIINLQIKYVWEPGQEGERERKKATKTASSKQSLHKYKLLYKQAYTKRFFALRICSMCERVYFLSHIYNIQIDKYGQYR